MQVMSTSDAAITSLGAQSVALSRCVNGTPFVNTPVSLRLAIRDTNPTVFTMNRAGAEPLGLPIDLSGNILPAGTKIEFSTTNGILLGENTYIVPNTSEPSAQAWIYTVQLRSDAAQSLPNSTDPAQTPSLICVNTVSSGTLNVKVTSPLGVITTRSYPVTD